MIRHSRGLGGSCSAAAVAALVVTLAGCSKQEQPQQQEQQQIVQGQCATVNGSDVCTWGEMSGNTLVAFGATVPMQSVENAPAEAPPEWPPVPDAVIPMPDAVKTASGFTELTMYWEAHGHPPGPYLTPHFDFHFYNISAADIDAIDCSDSTKTSQLPAAYELPDVSIPEIGDLVGLCVPKMGMHAVPTAELNSKTLFQKTMIVGYYHDEPIFVEPMITKATLLERHSFALDIPDVPDRPANVRYPTRFQAAYDSTTQAYRFVFSGLTGAGGAAGR